MAQISGLLAGLTQGHLFIGPDQVPGEQEDPAAEGHMLRFNVIESDMGLVQFGPQRLGRLGTHMGPPHRQEVLVGLLFGDEHDITVPGAGVDPLPRQCQPIERLLEGRELAMGDPIEPQPLAAEVRQFGQPEVPPRGQFGEMVAQDKNSVLGSPLAGAVLQCLRHHGIEPERGIHLQRVAALAHIHQVAQGFAGLNGRLGRGEISRGRRWSQINQMQTSKGLQSFQHHLLLGRKTEDRNLGQGNDRHGVWRSFLRLAILELTTPARSASAR
ncbi:hypothetical protein [Synechococcus sp. BO 8801]|uniref:hypothetical protein n=2 Tax=unclassified Synechococcus TaxID=2626047 RepID=UPI001E5D350A|nr:hypothetical protein [Synechococcus sp. BO 8801]